VLPRPDASSQTSSDSLTKGAERKAYSTLIAGVAAMLLAMPLGTQMGAMDHALMRVFPWLFALPPELLRWFLLILTAFFMAWAGRGIYLSAARGLRHGTTNMNTLVSLGTGVAFLYSAYATIWPAPERQVYFDAVLLIIGFLLLGKSLEGRAKRRALAALDSLSRLKPSTDRRIRDSVQTIVPLDEIQPGDSVLILPGERFPVDATILEGRTTVDESMLTGEPTPLDREPDTGLGPPFDPPFGPPLGPEHGSARCRAGMPPGGAVARTAAGDVVVGHDHVAPSLAARRAARGASIGPAPGSVSLPEPGAPRHHRPTAEAVGDDVRSRGSTCPTPRACRSATRSHR